MPPLVVNSRLHIPDAEIEFTYVRSSGPGGQNVNKVNSKACLRWNVRASTALGETVRQRFITRYAHRVTLAGDVLITSQRYRDQAKNTADCLEKLRLLIATAAVPPTVRKRTRPSKGAIERRLATKRQTSRRKADRGPQAGDDGGN